MPKWRAKKVGDERRVRRFAFLPTKVEDHWVWLSRFVSVQVYVAIRYADDVTYKWVEIEKCLPRDGSPSERDSNEMGIKLSGWLLIVIAVFAVSVIPWAIVRASKLSTACAKACYPHSYSSYTPCTCDLTKVVRLPADTLGLYHERY